MLIVPIDGVSYLAKVTPGWDYFDPVRTVPANWNDLHLLDFESDRLVWSTSSKESARLFVLEGLLLGDSVTKELPVPERYEFHALALRDGVLFAGGNCGREVLGSYDLAQETPRFVPLELPAELQRSGKSIDGLLFLEDRLLAVDDIVMPKWLLLYDVQNVRTPRLLEARPLRAHSSYETVRRCSLGASHIAVLSTTMNHGYLGVHIALLDPVTLTERRVLSGCAGGWATGGEEEFTILDIASWGNRLFLAGDRRGVGVLEVDLTQGATGPRSLSELRWIKSSRVCAVRPISDDTLAVISQRGPTEFHAAVMLLSDHDG